MLDVLKTRRSIRKYTDEMPRDDDLERIVEAGLYAPTGMDRQGVKFVVVKNKEMRDYLSKLNASVMVSDKDPFYGAPVVIVVLSKNSESLTSSSSIFPSEIPFEKSFVDN